MVLQFDLAARKHRQGPVPIIFQHGIAGYEFTIEKDMCVIPHHENPELIPLADRFVGDFERFAGIFLVVVKGAGADLTAVLGWLGVRIPNLHLGRTPQINPAVAVSGQLPVHQQFKIRVILRRTQAAGFAIKHDLAAFRFPMPANLFVRRLLGRFALLGCQFGALDGIVQWRLHQPFPAVEIFTVEQGGESLGCGVVFFRMRQFLDADVAELNVVVMAEKADVAAFPEQAGMLADDFRVGDIVKIGVHDGLAIHDDLDTAALGCDFLGIPLARRLECPAFGRDDAIDRTMILFRAQFAPFSTISRAILQNLNLHADIGGIAVEWCADAHAVVRAILQLELKAQDEIIKFLFREQISTAAQGAIDDSVGDAVTRAVLAGEFPARQRFPIEQGNEPRVVLGGDTRSQGGCNECSDRKKFHALKKRAEAGGWGFHFDGSHLMFRPASICQFAKPVKPAFVRGNIFRCFPQANALTSAMPIRWLFIVTLLLARPTFSATEFFVAPNGSDTNAGSKAKPFATLERARDAIRTLKPSQRLAKSGGAVWLRGGDYVRTNALEFTAADSGTADAPIIWRAYKNENVRLLGGRTLTGFTPVSDATLLARLDEPARGHIRQLNLCAVGITNFGEMKSRGFSRTALPAHCELFFDHQPMTLARWPNAGEFAKIVGYPAASDHVDEHGGNVGQLPGGFLYAGDRPRRWRDVGDLWVHGYWSYDWANSYERVASLDVEQQLVKTAAPYGLYGFRKDQRFYFLNVLEELDQPGEWFLDRTNGMLYFWPPNQKSEGRGQGAESGRELLVSEATGAEIVLSLLDQPLLKLTGVSNVTFRGLILEATRANAVVIRGGASNRIAGCLIRNIGNSGVVIDGGTGHVVVSCDVMDTGDGGVSLTGGDRQTLTPGGHCVENCHFQRLGRWSKCYVPAIAMTGVGLRASHNLIHDHPHCAILFWGNDLVVEFNEIHHIALETGDVGAIYTGRDYTFRGNQIRNNFIHHTGGVGMGSMGVYMDDCVSGTEVFGNVFYKVHWAMFIGGGRDHRVANNLFVDCDPAVRADGRGLDKTPVWHDMVDDTMRKQLAEVPLALYRQHYPEMKSLDDYYGPPAGPAITGEAFKGVPPDNNVLVRNVCIGKWLDVGWHMTSGMLRLENNLTNAAASLSALPNDQSRATDFVLTKDSPAWALGFQRIPVEKIGLRGDELRRGLKHLSAAVTP